MSENELQYKVKAPSFTKLSSNKIQCHTSILIRNLILSRPWVNSVQSPVPGFPHIVSSEVPYDLAKLHHYDRYLKNEGTFQDIIGSTPLFLQCYYDLEYEPDKLSSCLAYLKSIIPHEYFLKIESVFPAELTSDIQELSKIKPNAVMTVDIGSYLYAKLAKKVWICGYEDFVKRYYHTPAFDQDTLITVSLELNKQKLRGFLSGEIQKDNYEGRFRNNWGIILYLYLVHYYPESSGDIQNKYDVQQGNLSDLINQMKRLYLKIEENMTKSDEQRLLEWWQKNEYQGLI
jgi:hypothetical protein